MKFGIFIISIFLFLNCSMNFKREKKSLFEIPANPRNEFHSIELNMQGGRIGNLQNDFGYNPSRIYYLKEATISTLNNYKLFPNWEFFSEKKSPKIKIEIISSLEKANTMSILLFCYSFTLIPLLIHSNYKIETTIYDEKGDITFQTSKNKNLVNFYSIILLPLYPFFSSEKAEGNILKETLLETFKEYSEQNKPTETRKTNEK